MAQIRHHSFKSGQDWIGRIGQIGRIACASGAAHCSTQLAVPLETGQDWIGRIGQIGRIACASGAAQCSTQLAVPLETGQDSDLLPTYSIRRNHGHNPLETGQDSDREEIKQEVQKEMSQSPRNGAGFRFNLCSAVEFGEPSQSPRNGAGFRCMDKLEAVEATQVTIPSKRGKIQMHKPGTSSPNGSCHNPLETGQDSDMRFWTSYFGNVRSQSPRNGAGFRYAKERNEAFNATSQSPRNGAGLDRTNRANRTNSVRERSRALLDTACCTPRNGAGFRCWTASSGASSAWVTIPSKRGRIQIDAYYYAVFQCQVTIPSKRGRIQMVIPA